ncbi:G-type lectin S-receptor-like serine/threonine-protein kinase SD2-5 isoform X2 [Camellia sinensis]|uniref:G-type lectin S-receptor-like serine/threonine-protein kinase SD2-5 isoform X2 n=1 Tax=Camellia sinensis TaxID=4442 RepID=UPI00103690BF|nr:G-type lectin S-receptor-like serine/threonine-protein kinase SD2-5 isoform X2 [Camellia sinensis]
MGKQRSLCWAIVLLVFTCLIYVYPAIYLVNAQPQPVYYPIANLSTSWINTPSSSADYYLDSFVLNPILLRESTGIGCGFYCNDTYTACLFAVVVIRDAYEEYFNHKTFWAIQLVWSANRNHPVKLNATLQLTEDGELILVDADGTFVWSTNTAGKSVSGLNLTEEGNLVLFDQTNATVWQSFDHPTDTLLLGQMLVPGQKLTASTSESNWSQGMPTRFSYEDLKAMTSNFNNKLGEGGFGSVFQGTLGDGTKAAVKRLHGFCQIKKSFLAEVQTIGSIHHVNLVRLIGFCAQKSYRLLVYEYMSNGSLDKWIFQRHQKLTLGWQSRRKIIMDIAKGLAYLHEECRQKIIHLDIKPQNILLDEYFNAKISDFGLSKLIDKDQSQVVTTMRGTPGYLAPEWLSSIITEKADVYSFGVVILEILCGRKNLDRSQSEDDMHLLSLFKRKAEEERLIDIVDKDNEEMQLHGAEVVEMMTVAVWCLQSDFSRRPSMSMVVKVLEGSVDVENNLDYTFFNPVIPRTSVAACHQEGVGAASTLLFPSVLSGPR